MLKKILGIACLFLPSIALAKTVVIANASLGIPNISKDTLNALYQGQMTQIDDSPRLLCIDLPPSNPRFHLFYKGMLGWEIEDFRHYWSESMRNGNARMPLELPNDSAAVSYVASHRDAIAYVDSGAVTTNVNIIYEVPEPLKAYKPKPLFSRWFSSKKKTTHQQAFFPVVSDPSHYQSRIPAIVVTTDASYETDDAYTTFKKSYNALSLMLHAVTHHTYFSKVKLLSTNTIKLYATEEWMDAKEMVKIQTLQAYYQVWQEAIPREKARVDIVMGRRHKIYEGEFNTMS